jgi:alpha-ketoglutarate-dependent taurine dioxygenase
LFAQTPSRQQQTATAAAAQYPFFPATFHVECFYNYFNQAKWKWKKNIIVAAENRANMHATHTHAREFH